MSCGGCVPISNARCHSCILTAMIVAFTAILDNEWPVGCVQFSGQSIEHGVHATNNELREKPVPQPAERPGRLEYLRQMCLRTGPDFVQRPLFFFKRADRLDESSQGALDENLSAQPRDRGPEHDPHVRSQVAQHVDQLEHGWTPACGNVIADKATLRRTRVDER